MLKSLSVAKKLYAKLLIKQGIKENVNFAAHHANFDLLHSWEDLFLQRQ